MTLIVLAAGHAPRGAIASENADARGDDLDQILSDTLGQGYGESRAVRGVAFWKGFVEVKPRIYLNDRNQAKADEQMLLRSEFELGLNATSDLSSYFRSRLYIDVLGGEPDSLDLLEAYVTYERKAWNVRAGWLVENWGIVDTFSPMDIVNRRDFTTEILDPDRLGELGVRGRLMLKGNRTVGEPTLSLYVMPVFKKTRFPSRDHRFGLETDSTHFVESREFEPNESEEIMYALRYQSTLNTAPVNSDIQLVLARGPERSPYIMFFYPEDIGAVYFGSETLGIGIRAVPNADSLGEFLASLTLKLEAAYKRPYTFDDSPLGMLDDYTAYVVGFDKDFYNIFGKQDQLTLTVEFAGEVGASSHDPVTRSRAFSRDIISRLYWLIGDFSRSSLTLRSVYDLDVDEYLLDGVFSTSLLDIHQDLKGEVHLQYFESSNSGEGFFSIFPDNTSIAVVLRLDL